MHTVSKICVLNIIYILRAVLTHKGVSKGVIMIKNYTVDKNQLSQYNSTKQFAFLLVHCCAKK